MADQCYEFCQVCSAFKLDIKTLVTATDIQIELSALQKAGQSGCSICRMIATGIISQSGVWKSRCSPTELRIERMNEDVRTKRPPTLAFDLGMAPRMTQYGFTVPVSIGCAIEFFVLPGGCVPQLVMWSDLHRH